MHDGVQLDPQNMLAPRLGGRGVEPARLAATAARFAAVHQDVERRRAAGALPFFDLPYARDTVKEILRFARETAGAFDTVVVLGIGGSALGTIALKQALLDPFWNELDGPGRGGRPRLYVLDNIDPTTLAPFLERLDLRRTLFNVVSKSGTTAETMAQFMIVRDRLARALPGTDDRRHLVFTTDPERGVLRRIAREEQIATFPIPPGVGGRFSVLSAVGLLPAALTGIDIDGLLDGARAMDERCRTPELDANPAGLFATLQYLADTETGAPIHVLMAYSDRLIGVADWFRQLWAESLGKRRDRAGAEVFRGPTPVRALGATDQHSQVQLYIEGPFDKTITFLTLRESPVDLPIPRLYPEIEALGYLGGHTLDELLRAECEATAQALAREGRMNMTLSLPRLSAHALGQLFMLLEIATVYGGGLYDVDPLDQPGVELGKRLTYRRMGRDGFQDADDDADAAAPDARAGP
ncbi:MAG TPA: glucose-6-phosphate isomerase [Longimicrobiales bacterium]